MTLDLYCAVVRFFRLRLRCLAACPAAQHRHKHDEKKSHRESSSASSKEDGKRAPSPISKKDKKSHGSPSTSSSSLHGDKAAAAADDDKAPPLGKDKLKSIAKDINIAKRTNNDDDDDNSHANNNNNNSKINATDMPCFDSVELAANDNDDEWYVRSRHYVDVWFFFLFSSSCFVFTALGWLFFFDRCANKHAILKILSVPTAHCARRRAETVGRKT